MPGERRRKIAPLLPGAEDTFETAADAVIEGRLTELQALLRDQPPLATARSQREHHATLLHYVAANGVEQYRQKSPPNAVDCEHTARSRGGGGRARRDVRRRDDRDDDEPAGIERPPARGRRAGAARPHAARPRRRDRRNRQRLLAAGDGAGLLVRQRRRGVGRTRRARRYRRNGGREGRLDLLREMVTDDGIVRDGVPLLDVPWLRFGTDPQANLELATVWARIHDHLEVESYLVHRGVDAKARNNWGKPIA